jgi:RND family efflux transporter MFP subunit
MSDQLLADLAALRIDRHSHGTSRHDVDPERKSVFVYALTGVLLLGAGVLGYFYAYPYVEARLFKMDVALTEIALVSPAEAQIELTASGYVVPQILSKVGAKLTGRVARVLVRQGQRVRAGDELLKLDEQDQRAAIAAAQARSLAAEARVQTARANLAETEEQARRARTLAQRDVGPLANAVDLEARTQALIATVQAAQAEVRAAQAEVTTLKTALQQLTVLAPIDGTVLSKPPELGEVVGPQTTLLELGDLSLESLVVETDVTEARLQKVKVGGPCEIVLDAFPNRRLRGKTLEILPRVNRSKATVPVKVRFTDEVDGVLPDMAARVNFLSKELDVHSLAQAPKVLLPASALTERGKNRVVFVFDKEQDRIHSVSVRLGPPLSGGFELLQGPPAGTQIVRDPLPALQDGQRVREMERSDR